MRARELLNQEKGFYIVFAEAPFDGQRSVSEGLLWDGSCIMDEPRQVEDRGCRGGGIERRRHRPIWRTFPVPR